MYRVKKDSSILFISRLKADPLLVSPWEDQMTWEGGGRCWLCMCCLHASLTPDSPITRMSTLYLPLGWTSFSLIPQVTPGGQSQIMNWTRRKKTHLFHYLTEISTRVLMPFSPPPQSIRVMTGDFLDATASLVMALSVSQSVTKSVMHISWLSVRAVSIVMNHELQSYMLKEVFLSA